MPNKLIVLGRLGKPHGIKGEIRVNYDADSPLLLECPLFLRAGKVPPRPVRIASSRFWNDQLILRLEGIDDRSAAETLRGQELLINEADLPDADEDEPYLRDILGLPVLLADSGQRIGVLEDVTFPAGQEIWSIWADGVDAVGPDSLEPNSHVADAGKKNDAPTPESLNGNRESSSTTGYEILFPAVPEFVTDIDLDEGVIRINPPEGLLELYKPADGGLPDEPLSGEPYSGRKTGGSGASGKTSAKKKTADGKTNDKLDAQAGNKPDSAGAAVAALPRDSSNGHTRSKKTVASNKRHNSPEN